MAPATIIEFTDVECRVLQAERGKTKSLEVKALATVPLPPNSDGVARVAERIALLKEAIRPIKPAPQRVRILIPKHYVVSRKVTLPSIEDDELEGMARFEAERHIPFNAERHIIGHQVLHRQELQGSDVLLAAIDQPVAQEYVDICAGAGLVVDFLDVSAFALHRAFVGSDAVVVRSAAAAGQGESAEAPSNVVALVNVGAATTDIVILQDGKLSYARSSSHGIGKLVSEVKAADPAANIGIEVLARVDALEPHGYFGGAAPAPPIVPQLGEESAVSFPQGQFALGSHGTPTPPTIPTGTRAPAGPAAQAFSAWQLKLLRELRTTYEFARREFNCPMIERFYISGEGALIRNLPEYVTRNFSIEAAIFDPLSSTSLDPKVRASLEGGRSRLYAALAGALVPESSANAVNISLLPPDYISGRQARRQRQGYIVTAMLAITALAMAYIWFSDLRDRQTAHMHELANANEKMRTDVKELQAKKQRNEIVKNYVGGGHGAIEILDTLSSDTLFTMVPDAVQLSSFDYTKDESVKLVGFARTVADTNKFRQALQRTKFFEAVNEEQGNNGLTVLPRRGKEQVYNVNLTCLLPKLLKSKAPTSGEPAKSADADAVDGAGK